MKKLIALVLALVTITTVFVFPTHAADGGAGNLSITSHSDGDEVNGDEDIKIKWSRVSGADHYHLTIKDTVTGEKPFDEHVSGTSKTIKANTVFLVEGRTYKVYACAMDKNSNVLNRGSDWEAVYVSVKSNEPKLTYASPCLISPEEIEVKYLSNRNCYYGVATKALPNDQDVTLKFENVYSGNYSVSAAILSGEPDYGSSNEAKLLSIAAQQHQSSRKFKIDSEDLIPGKWLKFAVQAIDEDGNYSLLSHVYFFITDENTTENEDIPPVVEEPTTSNNDICLNGVDIEFDDGDYFTKNGNACSCHNNGICLVNESECNCLRYVSCNGKTVDLSAVQCFGFSRFCQLVAFGEHDGDSDNFTKTFTNVKAVDTTELKTALYGCAPGTHIRTSNSEKGYAHSVTVVSTTNSSVTIVDCNHSARCQISQRTYTWAELASFLNDYGGVDYISIYDTTKKSNSAVSEDVTVTPTVNGGTLEMSIPTTTATPGDTVEIPIMITKNPGFAFIQLDIDSDLDYVIENATSDFSMVEGKSTIFYGTSDKVGTFALAMLKVRIPDAAKDGHEYNISVNVIDCYNLEEQQLSCTSASGTINVSAVMMGDVTANGTVDGLDVIRLAKYLCGAEVSIDATASDISKDGNINGVDLILLLKLLLA